MPLEAYDILLTDLNIFTPKIYSSSHDDIVKSSHLSWISCTSDGRYWVSEISKKKKKNQDKVICNKLKLNSFEGLYE